MHSAARHFARNAADGLQLLAPVTQAGTQVALARGALTTALSGASGAPCLSAAPQIAAGPPADTRQPQTAAASGAAGAHPESRSPAASTDSSGASTSAAYSFRLHHHHQHVARRHFHASSPGHAAHTPHPGAAAQGPPGGHEASHESAHDDEYGHTSHEYGHESNSQEQGGQLDRDRALQRVLRSSNAAELAAVHFFSGAAAVLPRARPDAAFFAEQEQGAAEEVRRLLPRYRVRPSLAQGPLSLASFALGAAAAAAPPGLRLAIAGAVGDALTEHYNEQLRQLNDAGAAAQAPDVRRALRSLRDLPRAPEGAPPAPDLVSVIQEGVAAATAAAPPLPGGDGSAGPAAAAAAAAGAAAARGPTVLAGVAKALRELGLEGGVGAVVKAGARVALDVAAKV
ncbi:hypothetical protein HXX76_010838 [Chlamydomonas incerta]|uniref:Ubiquinone biosynthesis protein n=1 Tax=Chlamydomonas incerta TaxID=51695 RepID=A0A835T063_CHLIN|nr:hypothetical protein HXX76_010838 [Chlamydomonas incerta]|eukprot:KAG2429605.1 hypothetical protein HXX76_010838 [Chlamydomonas incerta]